MNTVRLANGISLEYQHAGEPADPAIVLVSGITGNITDWPDVLVNPLVKAGYQVIGYELRDTGHSSRCGDETPFDVLDFPCAAAENRLPEAPYTLHDMVEDLAGLMDCLSLQKASILGYSYGAAVAQLFALRHPGRIEALISLQGTNYNPALSPRREAVALAMAGACKRYRTKVASVEAITEVQMAINGVDHCLARDEARAVALLSVNRMYYPAGTARMILSRFATAPWHEQTRNIDCPALILHGTDDPIFPPDHADDMARRIPNSTLQWLKGAGHNHPPSLYPVIVHAVLGFLGRALETK